MSDANLELARKHISEMMEQGWTAAAIAREGGLSPITLGNIKNGKATRVTDKVLNRLTDLRERIASGAITATTKRPGRPKASAAGTAGTKTPDRRPGRPPAVTNSGKKQPASTATGSSITDGMINTDFVPVDIVKLQQMIDLLIERFSGAIDELEGIKSQLKL
ncbi:MAG: hypothetical protein KFH87_04990 [Bacteroidetes bacterium]|nr:hypothetical protein [Bacteroidota bacterium]